MKKNLVEYPDSRSPIPNPHSRIFITGGCGFVGANLVKYLLDKENYAITIYDNLSTGSKENLKRAISDSSQKGKVSFIEGDILDTGALNRAVKGHEAVVHFAAHTRVVESLQKPDISFTINSAGTFNVLESARKNKVSKFIFASSNAVIGEQAPPINEKMLPKPLSLYGASKLHGEALCSAYFHSYGLKTISLRFANIYGPYSEHKTSVIPMFLKIIQKGKPLEIYGDGEQTRDFIHADDISQAIYLCLTNNQFPITDNRISNTEPWGEVFQIATGEQTKIKDLALIIQELSQEQTSNALKIVFKDKRKGEIKRNFSDITKAKTKLGFKPNITLHSGLKKLLPVFQKF